MELSQFLFYLLLSLAPGMLAAQNKAEALRQDSTLKFPQLTFVAQQYDFGEIRKGEKITTSFYFKNTGTKPLYLLQVQTSCGCTATNWSREAVAPNAVGEITVIYDSAAQENQEGPQEKALLVISNALNKEVILLLKGKILKPD
ncbi:MAG: DUF1573 domain-containing protein [Microscillaceae bacterium]|nr:DUF1573 domain-containing protein [Microscillaceae bacterium]